MAQLLCSIPRQYSMGRVSPTYRLVCILHRPSLTPQGASAVLTMDADMRSLEPRSGGMYPETLQLLCWYREAKCLGKKLREYKPRTAEKRILCCG